MTQEQVAAGIGGGGDRKFSGEKKRSVSVNSHGYVRQKLAGFPEVYYSGKSGIF